MKKALSALVSFLLLIPLATGCNGSPSSSSSASSGSANAAGEPSAASEANPITIEYWPDSADQDSWVAPIISDFEKAYPNITVKYNKNNNIHAGSGNAVQVAASTDSLPDCWYAYGGSIGGDLVKKGFTADLTQWASDHKWDTKFNKAGISLATWDGKIQGVPIFINGMGVFYNKAAFSKAGISNPPASFSELESDCAKLKAAGITPFAIGGKDDWMVMRFQEDLIEAKCGSQLHDEMFQLKASWNNDDMKAVYQTLRDWTVKEYFIKGFMSLDPSNYAPQFYKGTVAMAIDGNWAQSTYLKDGQGLNNFGFFPFPSDQTPLRLSSFVNCIQINSHKSQESQEAALTFAEYMTDKATIDKYEDKMGGPVATLGVTYAPSMIFTPIIANDLNTGNFVVADQVLTETFKPSFYEAQDKVILGEMTPDQAVAFIDKAVKAQASSSQ